MKETGEIRCLFKDVNLFNAAMKALTVAVEVAPILRRIADELAQLSCGHHWTLWLLGDDGLLHVALVHGASAEKSRGMTLAPGEGVVGKVFSSGKPLLTQHTHENAPMGHSVLTVLLGCSMGVLEVTALGRGHTLGLEDMHAAIDVADFLGIAIHNARLHQKLRELTLRDEHTGLYNARHLRTLLEAEVARSARHGHALAVLFLDLDEFKCVNDTYGHLVGTTALRHVGQLLTSCVRKADSAFRYGGDEFAVLLVETDAGGAATVAQRFVEAFRAAPLLLPSGLSLPLTVSIGYACYPGDGTTGEALLRHADASMYQAKRAGSNRVAPA